MRVVVLGKEAMDEMDLFNASSGDSKMLHPFFPINSHLLWILGSLITTNALCLGMVLLLGHPGIMTVKMMMRWTCLKQEVGTVKCCHPLHLRL
jgi:hypothetical protein